MGTRHPPQELTRDLLPPATLHLPTASTEVLIYPIVDPLMIPQPSWLPKSPPVNLAALRIMSFGGDFSRPEP